MYCLIHLDQGSKGHSLYMGQGERATGQSERLNSGRLSLAAVRDSETRCSEGSEEFFVPAVAFI